MEVTDALEEAHERWGEGAAIYRDRSGARARYEVGYLRRNGEALVFHAMGIGSTLERAFQSAPESEPDQ
jgi:hypothetical protein